MIMAPQSATSFDQLFPSNHLRQRQLTIMGGVLCLASAAIGLLCLLSERETPGVTSSARLVLALAGSVLLGSAISMDSKNKWPWIVAGVNALLLASFGIPSHWDSFQLLARVLGIVAIVAGVLFSIKRSLAQVILLGFVLFHFSSILCATTWPEPAPWLTVQVGQRIFLPFMQFTYLRNAYHFYSPDPGPANLLFMLIETEEKNPTTGENETKNSWVIMPHRGTDMRDPLGVSYYRRLSITESAARVGGDLGIVNEEKKQIVSRREAVALGTMPGHKMIPYAPESFEPRFRQHLQPTPDVTRYILPSYAKHICNRYTTDKVKVTKVRLYRAEHKIVTTPFFVTQNMSPYYPTLFRIYFLGDYTPDGKLIDTQDPMLYWVVPILPKSGKRPLNEINPDDIDDYLSKHAGYEFNWRSLRP